MYKRLILICKPIYMYVRGLGLDIETFRKVWIAGLDVS